MPNLTISLHSDWRIGSGTGRPGDIDQLIRRDRHGMPFIPAKTLTGVLRDSCERVAYALDNGNLNGPWHTWLIYLFGNHPRQGQMLPPMPAHLKLSSAHVHKDLRNALQGKPALQTALTFVKPGVKISLASGTVEDRCFRLEEMARGGVTLHTTCEVNLPSEDKEKSQVAYALLAAGATLTEHIGGKRRRGAGRCRIHLEEMPATKAYDYLAANPTPSVLPDLPMGSTRQDSNSVIAATASEDWCRVPLTLTTEQPVIVAKGTVGNVVESLDHIPGTHLLPIVVRHLRKFGIDIGAAIAQSQLIITNALPSIDGNISQPVPFALFYEKQPEEKQEEALSEEGPSQSVAPETPEAANQVKIKTFTNKLLGEPADDRQRKQQRRGYLSLEPATSSKPYAATLCTVATGIETHNTVEDKLQRPTSDVGGVYSYQAIPVGTVLRAELRLQADLAKQLEPIQRSDNNLKWYERFGSSYSVGVSRKDEYGRIAFAVGSPQAIEENHPALNSNQSPVELTIWLLSDLLLRDAWLRPSTEMTDFYAALAVPLGLQPQNFQLVETANQSEKASALLTRQRRHESWQTRWGLPRPSLAGISAGSCFRLKLVGDDLPAAPSLAAAIKKLETTGLGERRVEGYGQLKINAPLLSQNTINVRQLDSQIIAPSKATVPAASPIVDYARKVEEVAWRSAIQRAAAALAGDSDMRENLLQIRSGGEASLTQLGGLRSQLTKLRAWQDTDPIRASILKWLEAMIKKENKAQATLQSAKGLLEDNQAIWGQLNLPATLRLTDGYSSLCCTGDTAEERLKGELWGEAVEVLIGECIRAHSSAAQKSTDQKGGE